MKIRSLVISLTCIAALLFLSTNVQATGQLVFTSTADFDNGTKEESGANYFAENGIDQPSNFINYPNSYYHNGRTFVAWQGDENYSMYVTYYDHTSGTWGTAKRVVNGATENPVTGDGHGSPALLVDNSGFVHMFCCSHDSAIQHYKTNAAGDISAWTEKAEITGALTYPHPVLVGTRIYLLYRTVGLPNGPWAYRMSSDGGESWGSSTTYLDFSDGGGTAYVGGTQVWADQIHQTFVWHRNVDAERYNGYAIWLNTTTGNVFCATGTNQGLVINKTEADTVQCRFADSFTTGRKTNFGSIHVNSTGYPYITWRSGSTVTLDPYQVYFLVHNDFAWVFFNFTWTDHFQNYVDHIVHSSTYIELFVTANSTGTAPLYEGGDIERWSATRATDTDGVFTLVRNETILREVSSGKPLDAPIVPVNFHPDFKVVFNQRHFDAFGPPSDGPANARLYAWGNSGFLFNPAFTFGSKGVETNTECVSILTGEFQLASNRCDTFSNADSDGVTFNWGNATVPQYGTGSTIIDWTESSRTISNGEMNISFDADGSNARWGIVATAQLTGDFNVSIRTFKASGCSTFACGFYLNVFNEQVLDGFTPATATVDGVFYYREASTTLQTYTLTNGVETFLGTTDNPGGTPLWLAISKVGTTITWYYRTSDSGAWTQDQTTTFATDALMFVSIVVWSNDGPVIQYGFDQFNIASTGMNVVSPGFRPSGSWTTPVQTFNGEIVNTLIVNYTGASATAYIDTVSIIDATTGFILFSDPTNRISGSTITLAMSDDTKINLFNKNWKVRIALAGNGAGSAAITEIVVNTIRSQLTVAISDMPWLIVFIAIMATGLIIAWVIRKKRGGEPYT